MQSQVYATVASGIEAVEAGHAAIIRYQLSQVVCALRCVLCLAGWTVYYNYSLHIHLVQIASAPTGLTLDNADPISFETAVVAINTLRNALGGTTSSSVENSLTRKPTAVSGVTTADSAPNLFAADANSVAYTRIPRQVGDFFNSLLHARACCHELTALTLIVAGAEYSVLFFFCNTWWLLSQRNSR